MSLRFPLVCSLSLVLVTVCSGANYNVTDLGTLGGSFSEAFGINNNGQVTGQAFTTGDASGHAFLWDGTMHDIGTFDGSPSSVTQGESINDNGLIVGGYNSADFSSVGAFQYDGTMHGLAGPDAMASGVNNNGQISGSYIPSPGGNFTAFLYDGTVHDLGTLPGGLDSEANGINASGQVTGISSSPNGDRAFLYDGTMHDLGTLGGSQSQGNAINALGQVVGFADTTDEFTHAFFYDGTMHDLGTLGGSYSEALGINASGQVVGDSLTSGDATTHAFVYSSGGGMVDLNSLISPSSGWELIQANAINDLGQIVGLGIIGGESHAFLLSASVPEPSSLVVAAFGTVILLVYQKRKYERSRATD